MDKKLEIVSQEYCDEETKEKLDEISQLEGVKEIVSFPDSSLVSGLTPKSSVIKTKDVIYPEFGSVANNCGMGVIKTDLNSEDITKQKIKEFGKKIKAKKVNPDFRVDKERAKNIFLEGVEYTSKYSEVISPENVENRGNMFSSHNRYFEINQVIPKIILDKFLDRNPYFPIKGNHFIELQAIDSIADENMASKWGLEEKQVLISIHGGYSLNNVLNYLYVNRSEIEKKDILERTSSKIAKLWFLMSKSNSLKDFKNRANLIFDNEPFTPFYTDTKEGKRMIDCLNLGMNYAYGLRSLFYSHLSEIVSDVFGTTEMNLLWDCSHDSIQKENGNWLSRKGVCKINNNNPSIISGSYNFNSCIVAGGKNREKYLNSHDHGCGNLIDLVENEVKKSKETATRFNLNTTKTNEVQIMRNKPIKELVNILKEKEILKPVVWSKPIANYKKY